MPSEYKVISLLLRYPDENIVAAGEEIAVVVAALEAGEQRRLVELFLESWSVASLRELQERYVQTFDLRRQASLYMTFYTHGDTRKRGMALLRLKKLYRAAGLPWDSAELPDYLPAMLEFAALAPPGCGEQLLRDHRLELEALRLALHDSGSDYLHLIDAVAVGLGEIDAPGRERLAELIRNGPPSEQVGIEPFAPPEVMPRAGARG